MLSSYKESDVKLLLKDITGKAEPLDALQREAMIQNGIHYSELLPKEYVPTNEYMKLFFTCLERFASITAEAVASVAEQIYSLKDGEIVLVSLARAGTPIGILIKRYLEQKYNISVMHYSISIIRDRGIDKNAMEYILRRHSWDSIQFVDGWTGKGAIQNTLTAAMKDYEGVSDSLAVLSDPAYISEICGTHDDFIIASSCLNSTVSGLISRTVLNDTLIGKDDFHGAVYYEELKRYDLTYSFIDRIVRSFPNKVKFTPDREKSDGSGLGEVEKIRLEFGINDINHIKPGIGETTRVLLRRIPWKILVHSENDTDNLGHIYQLAEDKGVEIVKYPLKCYKACGIIRSLNDV